MRRPGAVGAGFGRLRYADSWGFGALEIGRRRGFDDCGRVWGAVPDGLIG